jgi:pilus assembly protein Flp/PilA
LLSTNEICFAYFSNSYAVDINFLTEPIMSKFIARMQNDEAGVTAIEYGLIAAAIAVVIIAAVTLLGSGLGNTFGAISNVV